MASIDKTRIELPQTVCSKSHSPPPLRYIINTLSALLFSLCQTLSHLPDRMVLLLRNFSDFPCVSCSHLSGTNGLYLFLSLHLSQYTNAFIYTSVVDYGPQCVHNSLHPHCCGVQHPFWLWGWPWDGFGKYVNHRCYANRILKSI